MKITVLLLFSLILLAADKLPSYAFLGYDGTDWVVSVTRPSGKTKEIHLQQEPHSFDYDFRHDRVIYIGANGILYLYDKGDESKITLPKTTSKYTQPSFICAANAFYAVELLNGNSKSTQIVSIDLNNTHTHTVVQQNSSQFEPSQINRQTLLFTNLVCNHGCGKLMQEIWKKDLILGSSDQLTLLNAFSNNPSVHPNDHWLFFSSNKNERYHIWAKDLHSDKRSVEVTQGSGMDSFVNALGQEDFLYIHQDQNGYALMYGDIEGKSHKIALSKPYEKIRQLKVDQCQ